MALELTVPGIEPTTCLVMLVKRQQGHLAMASGMPHLHAHQALCGLAVDDGEVLGEIDDEDLPVLQDFNICPACSAAFAADLRPAMLARASQVSSQPPPCMERLYIEANQLPLF